MHHIVFHRADLDGIGSCMVVLRKLFYDKVEPENIYLHAWNYGEPMPLFEDCESIYIVDCSFTPEEMLILRHSSMGDKVTWIDHHKTSYEDSIEYAYDNFNGVRSTKLPSAIQLCWSYLFGEQIPNGIGLLSDYDTWQNQDKHKWDRYILPYQYGMRNEDWLGRLMEHDPKELITTVNYFQFAIENTLSFIQGGSEILRYQEIQNKIASSRAFSFRYEGITFACINQGGGNSSMFTDIPFMYEAVMSFAFDGKKMKWKFSMYNVNDRGVPTNFDLSIIAKAKGGGGHANACGFEVRDLKEVFGEMGINSDNQY